MGALGVSLLVRTHHIKSQHIYRPLFLGVGLIEVDHSHGRRDHQFRFPQIFTYGFFLKEMFMKQHDSSYEDLVIRFLAVAGYVRSTPVIFGKVRN